MVDPAFWHGRRALVTGHTGFKGAWLTLWLRALGADVVGLSHGPVSSPSLYDLARAGAGVTEVDVDVRDCAAVGAALRAHAPEVVIHMAAQPLVRRSFADPRATYEINVMGTVNVLEAVRGTSSVRAVVVVTSDKCYANREDGAAYVEDDPKGGGDPYSSSKACAELVVDAYRRSFFAGDVGGARVASARAGNVIGGGDWGEDRLIPDIMRAALAGAVKGGATGGSGGVVALRNPGSVRPWQHVLNPLSGYLRLAEALIASPDAAGGWNFGPALGDARPVGWIVERLGELWPGGLRAESDPGPHPHEAHLLSLDSTKARERLGWAPTWDLDAALRALVDWYRALQAGEDMRSVTLAQIDDFVAAAALSAALRAPAASGPTGSSGE